MPLALHIGVANIECDSCHNGWNNNTLTLILCEVSYLSHKSYPSMIFLIKYKYVEVSFTDSIKKQSAQSRGIY